MADFYLQVILNRPLRRVFEYLPLPNTKVSDYVIGGRIAVPFANQRLIGVVFGITDQCDWPANKLKAVQQIIDSSPVLNTPLMELCQWMAAYYQQPIGEVVTTLLPAELRANVPCRAEVQTWWRLTDLGKQENSLVSIKGHRQIALLTHLRQHPEAADADLRFLGFSSQQFKALEKRQLIERIERSNFPEPWLYQPAQGLPLNAEQQAAVDAVTLDRFCSYVLFGVTGSGKTEVYMQLIDKVLAQGKQVLMLVPEIGLTPQSVERISQRFSCPVAISHSGMSNKERLNQWLMVQAGACPIILGTRSAVFLPAPNLGLIVVDEEHDSSFKQNDGIRYHGRDIAIKRAHSLNIPIVLGSATPALESLNHALNGKYQLLSLRERAGEAQLPFIETVDIRSADMASGLSETVRRRIGEHLQAGFQVLVFINRRGYAPTLYCKSCGWVAGCPRCDAKLTLHRNPASLRCHHCGFQSQLPPVCPSCKQPELASVGTGTVRTEEQLHDWFNDTAIIRIDRDSTTKLSELTARLAQVQEGEPCILVGTQMLAKGHHLPKVTLAVIVDGDGGFFSTDFRAEEKMLQLLIQVAGRAGRETHRGEVLIQTRYPHHPMFTAVAQQDYLTHGRVLLAQRQQQLLPPFSHLAMLRVDHKNAGQALAKLRELRAYLEQAPFKNRILLGPTPAQLSKRANMYRYWLWIQSVEHKTLHQLVQAACYWLDDNAKGMSWGVDVDPLDVI